MLRLLPALLLVACGGTELPGTTTVPVEGEVWEGTRTLDGKVVIPEGTEVVVAAGTTLEAQAGAWLDVRGTLRVEGTADAPVVLDAPDGWGGIALDGTLIGDHFDMHGVGGKLVMIGGTLDLADSTLDLENPTKSPDCTGISGGNVTLDHVRITGCHCPIHINRADDVQITGSVFDGAAVAVMIANTEGTLTGNDIDGGLDLQDIGGGLAVDVSGNWWGADGVTVQGDEGFTGLDDALTSPVEGAGPRR